MLKVPVRKVIVVGVGVVQKAALFNHELARVDVGLARRSVTEQRAAEQRKQREAAKLTASVAKERRIARLQGRCASVRRDLHGVDRALVDGA